MRCTIDYLLGFGSLKKRQTDFCEGNIAAQHDVEAEEQRIFK
jgi:hypothetical protein